MYNRTKKTSKFKKKIKPTLSKKRLGSNLVSKSKYNENLFFSPKEPLFEIELKSTLTKVLYNYTQDNTIPEFFQNNKNNEKAYSYFYNELSGKIGTSTIIGLDRGKNIALAPNLVCKFFCSLTYLVELTSYTILTFLAATTRCGINKLSERRKIKSAKNKLDHLITDPNFIRLISIILTKTHESDFAHQEKLDYFVREQFLSFWTLFKRQAKIETEIPDLTTFWSTFLIEYFKALKCPLLKNNFLGCLDEMHASVNRRLQACPENLTGLNVNEANQPKNINQTITENIYLPQLILQLAQLILKIAICYLTQLIGFMHAAKMSPQASVSSKSVFWQPNTKLSVNFNQPMLVASICTLRLI